MSASVERLFEEFLRQGVTEEGRLLAMLALLNRAEALGKAQFNEDKFQSELLRQSLLNIIEAKKCVISFLSARNEQDAEQIHHVEVGDDDEKKEPDES